MPSNKAVHPSEISGGRKEKKTLPKNPRQTNAISRFLARIFDYSILALIFFLLRIFGILDSASWDFALPLEFLIWIPIEAFFLYKFLATPGKMLLGIRVIPPQKFTYEIALKRSFMVWARGLGLGLYILPFITMFYAYSRYLNTGITSWDRDLNLKVEHRSLNIVRVIICVIFILFVFFIGRFY